MRLNCLVLLSLALSLLALTLGFLSGLPLSLLFGLSLGLPLGLTLCFILRWGIYGLWIGLTLALVVIGSSLLMRWRKDSNRIAQSA